MKTNLRCSPYHLANYVLFFSIILLLSCTSTSFMRLEGNDFKENLPGLWEGNWHFGSMSGKQHIKITKIDGNKVDLTGWSQGGSTVPEQNEVYGGIENSTLILTWPLASCTDKYKMIRDDSNNLILDGRWKCSKSNGKVQLKKNG